ncbi:hypothetical protein SBOR_7118 [Sclerotinia borealis F-4128]|uniref:Uncharacterized protein n=1 Tax=Sclerotinia borealis (strain F-4128) TaxID=1432307 RepID=W9C9M3_SCLBF|nr:hypothetical protein SBOR_7118 [Sclerotinia borealis F-4128]
MNTGCQKGWKCTLKALGSVFEGEYCGYYLMYVKEAMAAEVMNLINAPMRQAPTTAKLLEDGQSLLADAKKMVYAAAESGTSGNLQALSDILPAISGMDGALMTLHFHVGNAVGHIESATPEHRERMRALGQILIEAARN